MKDYTIILDGQRHGTVQANDRATACFKAWHWFYDNLRGGLVMQWITAGRPLEVNGVTATDKDTGPEPAGRQLGFEL